MTKTHEQRDRAAPRLCSCAKLVLADWTEERERFISNICPDGSITDTHGLIELVKEMRYFYDRINEDIEEREQLRVEVERLKERAADGIRNMRDGAIKEYFRWSKMLQDPNEDTLFDLTEAFKARARAVLKEVGDE